VASQQLDLNSIDFWAWSYFEACTNKRAHTTKTFLIATIKENFASLDRYILTWDCRRLRRRVGAVIDAGGDFIE
jgi:hypothetical protein